MSLESHQDESFNILDLLHASMLARLEQAQRSFATCPPLMIKYIALIWSNRVAMADAMEPVIVDLITLDLAAIRHELVEHLVVRDRKTILSMSAQAVFNVLVILFLTKLSKRSIQVRLDSVMTIDQSKLVGSGSFGTVFQDKDLAVKLTQLFHKGRVSCNVMCELAALCTLQDADEVPIVPRVSSLLIDMKLNAIGIYMAKYDASLHEIIKSKRVRELDLISCVQSISYNMSLAHHYGIVHLDIKPGNVLIAFPDHIVMCDWGLSRLLLRQEPMQRVFNHTFVTLTHRSPDLLLGSPCYRMSDDVWAVGIVMKELVAQVTESIDIDCTYSQLIKIAWMIGKPAPEDMIKFMVRYQLEEPLILPSWPPRLCSQSMATSIDRAAARYDNRERAANILKRCFDGTLCWQGESRLTMVALNTCLQAIYDEIES